MQAKDVDADELVALISECNNACCDYSFVERERGWGAYHGGRPGYKFDPTEPATPHWANCGDLALKLNIPDKVLRAKVAKLLKQGRLVSGCACGCRGDLIAAGTKLAQKWGL